MVIRAYREGWSDVKNSLKMLSMAFYFAWGDTKARYRRSILGPFWIVLSTSISVAGLGFLWSALLKDEPAKLVPSLTVGLIIWQLLSGCINESTSLFVRNSHFIRNIPISYFIFIIQLLVRQLINFGHNFLVVILVLIIFPPDIGLVQLLVFPGLLLVICNLAWITLLLAIVSARFRDVEQIIGALMPLIFFLSPVIYRPSQLSIRQEIVWLNPFSYLITLVRDPVMGVQPPLFVYIISLLALLLGSCLTIYQFGKRRGRIAFWI